MKPLGKVQIKWNPDFAYAIGLLTTDGSLSKDGRHIDFTSKDKDLILIFKNCLNLDNKIGMKSRSKGKIKKYYRIQFSDKIFYNFLISIGLSPKKSNILKNVKIPKEYFPDFLRGCLDGDGNINIFSHSESRHQQLRIRLSSGSYYFLVWLKIKIKFEFNINGGWIEKGIRAYTLSYGKKDSIRLFEIIYYLGHTSRLERKLLKARYFLRM